MSESENIRRNEKERLNEWNKMKWLNVKAEERRKKKEIQTKGIKKELSQN